MRRPLLTVLALAGVMCARQARGTVPADLAPLTFLIGEWEASGTGKPGEASGRAVFATGLQDRVIVRTSFAEYPASAERLATRHDDLMVIYVSPGGGVRADYYDNEGHVIRYIVSSPRAGEALFVSDATANEPRFRLTYRLGADGILQGDFAIAPPGKADAFTGYLTWESRKAR